FVVDDAIVMMENIARHLEQGEPPLQAALEGAKEIAFTLLSLTFSLVAVLIPLLFMSDAIGRFFRECAVTLAVAILLSLLISRSLTPTMCAPLLRADSPDEESRFQRGAARRMQRLVRGYDRTLTWVLRQQWLTLLVAAGTFAL